MTTIQIPLPFDTLLKNLPQLNAQELTQLVQHAARLQAQRRAPSLSQAETDLLLNISRCAILPATQQRCAELTRRQRTQLGLVQLEQDELMALVDEIEEVNARRMGYLVELAHIRQISVDELMQRLEIRPITYG
jgi:transcription initiation factor IIF auxiliary subunit